MEQYAYQEQAQAEALALPALIARSWELAAMYSQTARQVSGKDSALLRRLGEESQAQGACLKGIYQMRTGMKSQVCFAPTRQETLRTALRRSYGKELELMGQFDQRRDQAEYGHVYRCLAVQCREHCAVLLEVLGRTSGDPSP